MRNRIYRTIHLMNFNEVPALCLLELPQVTPVQGWTCILSMCDFHSKKINPRSQAGLDPSFHNTSLSLSTSYSTKGVSPLLLLGDTIPSMQYRLNSSAHGLATAHKLSNQQHHNGPTRHLSAVKAHSTGSSLMSLRLFLSTES